MADYATDEQQVEALKKWWAENGYHLLAGVVLGLGILFAWNWWNNHQNQQGKEASDAYISMMSAVKAGSLEQAKALKMDIHEDYSGTPYAPMASMALAKLQVENNALAAAAENLQWVIEHAKQDEVVEIATIRKARVLLATGELEQSEKLLKSGFPPAYTSIVEELKGDLFSAKGDTEAARVAYDKALLTAGGTAEFLQLKRDALGNPRRHSSDNAL